MPSHRDPGERRPQDPGLWFIVQALSRGSTASAAAIVLLALAQAAFADVRGASEAGGDPRRTRSGAALTAEVNPDEAAHAKSDSERVNESYQPKGIELGSFLFLPKIEVDETFSSNVYATEVDTKSDSITTIRPSMKLRSRFKEHELNFSLQAEQYLFATYTSDDRTEIQADLDGRYDFNSNTQASFSTEVYARHEDRGSPDDAHGVAPTPTQGVLNTLKFKHQRNRYTFQGEFESDRLSFDNVATANGAPVINTDRNRWELTARERASYEMAPGYAAVIELSENKHYFDSKLDRAGFDRNSSGYRVETGVGVDISQLIRGDFLLGYFHQEFKDSRLTDPEGLSVRATFNWTPDKLTLVVPSFSRTVSDTTTAQASALVHNAATVTVRHELRRNVVLTGFGSVAYDQLSGVENQNAMTYEVKGKAIYAFTPQLFVGGEIGYKTKASEAALASYDQTTVMLRIGVQY